MSQQLPEPALRVWQRLQVVTEQLRRNVGRTLRTDAHLSDTEFAVLAHLAGLGGSARPTDCARAMGWDSSRLAHQLRRLERRALVVRRTGAGTDGRESLITISESGRSAHRGAVGAHLRAARVWFADALTTSQLDALDDALRALSNHISRLDPDSAVRKDGNEDD